MDRKHPHRRTCGEKCRTVGGKVWKVTIVRFLGLNYGYELLIGARSYACSDFWVVRTLTHTDRVKIAVTCREEDQYT